MMEALQAIIQRHWLAILVINELRGLYVALEASRILWFS